MSMQYDLNYIAPETYSTTNSNISSIKISNRDLKVQIIKDGYIVPATQGQFSGGILDANEIFVQSSISHESETIKNYNNLISDTSNEVVIYLGLLHNVWGHCLTDSLRRLWYIMTEDCKSLLSAGAKLVYVSHDNLPLKPYAEKLLALAGVDVSKCHMITKKTRFSIIYMPESCFFANESSLAKDWTFTYTKEFSNTISMIKSKIQMGVMKEYERVYFSRTHLNTHGRDMGEKALENVFKKMGYCIVHPQEISFERQLQILISCKEFVSTEGSISHSAVFCRPGTRVIILRKSAYVNGYQTIINEVSDLNVTYIDTHNSLRNMQWCNQPMYGPFYMCITPELERFVGHKIFHLPLGLRPSWWWYCNRNRKIFKHVIPLLRLLYF